MCKKTISCNYLILGVVVLFTLMIIMSNSALAQKVVGGQCGVCGTWYEGSHSCSGGERRGDDGPPLGDDYTPPPPPEPTPGELMARKLLRDLKAANDKGVEYFNEGDYDMALKYFEEALDSSVYNEDAAMNKSNTLNQLGIECESRGDYETAIEYYKEASVTWPHGHNPILSDNLRRAEELVRDLRAAAALRKEKEEQDRREEERRKEEMSQMLDDLKEEQTVSSKGPSPTIKPFRENKSQKPEDLAHALTVKALNAAMRGDFEAEIDYYRAALKHTPNDRGIQLALGHALYIRDRDKDKGQQASLRTEFVLDALQQGHGDWEANVTYLQDALAKETDKERAQAVREALNYVKGLYAYQQYQESREMEEIMAAMNDLSGLEELLVVSPDTVSFELREGFRQLESGDFDAAISSFESARVLGGNSFDIQDILSYAEGLRDARQKVGESR